jgi:hypothetical protein
MKKLIFAFVVSVALALGGAALGSLILVMAGGVCCVCLTLAISHLANEELYLEHGLTPPKEDEEED